MSGQPSVKLNGVFAFKEAMGTLYNEKGEAVPVTVLRFEPWFVSQIKTKEKDGYSSVQLACHPKKGKNSNKAEKGHFKSAQLESGARYVKEFRCEVGSDVQVGGRLDIDSLKKGDIVSLTGCSKGRGFAGVLRRYGMAGGPASHGSKFHRRPGSSGNRTWPGRVLPGKRFPGHYGDKTVSVKNVLVVEVLPDEGVLMVKGPVPGARNSLVKMVKMVRS